MGILVILGTIIFTIIMVILLLFLLSSDRKGIYKFLLSVCYICLVIGCISTTVNYIQKKNFNENLNLYQIKENDFKTITKVDFHDLDKLKDLGFKTYKIYKRLEYKDNTILYTKNQILLNIKDLN